MDPDRWYSIENSVREKFPPSTLGLCEWRYCFPCTSFRPPRAHHCSVCNACVLRMDHHCPWVGNCVGHKNHKLFWNFLLNSTLGCLFVSVNMIYSAVYISFDKFERDTKMLITMIASSALVFSLSGLLGVHTYIMVCNLSTLEMDQLGKGNSFMHKKKKLLSSSERKRKLPLQLLFGVKVVQETNSSVRYKMVNDYSRNWTDYMGVNAWWWLVPVPASDQTCSGYNWTLYPRTMAV
jgi:palmitoyltransferase